MSELTGPERCMIFKPVSFRPARREHKVSCAGCDCEPGTTCDTRKICTYCGLTKTACDAALSDKHDGAPCCTRCHHRAI